MRVTLKESIDAHDVSNNYAFVEIPAGTYELVRIDNPIGAIGYWWVLKDDKRRGAVLTWWRDQIDNGVVVVESRE